MQLQTIYPKHMTCTHAVHKPPPDMHLISSSFSDLQVIQMSAQGFTLDCMQCTHCFLSLTIPGTFYWKGVDRVTCHFFPISSLNKAVLQDMFQAFTSRKSLAAAYSYKCCKQQCGISNKWHLEYSTIQNPKPKPKQKGAWCIF